MSRTNQASFNAGILAPALWGRTDLDKYRAGLKDGVNVLVMPEGGAENRAGTKTVTGYGTGTTPDPQWLIPFEFSSEDTYVLEFADDVMRVIKNGAYVLASASALTIVALTVASPATITLADAGEVATFPVGNLIFIQDPSGTSPLHQATLKVTGHSGSDLQVEIVGNVAIDNSADLWGGLHASATVSLVYQVVSPFGIEEMPLCDYAQDVETLYFAHPDHPKRFVFRDGADDDWVFGTIAPGSGLAVPTDLSSTATGTGTVTYEYVVTRVGGGAGIPVDAESKPSAVRAQENNLTIAGQRNNLTWTVPTLTPEPWYNVYKRAQNGAFGYIGTGRGVFADNNIIPDMTKNPPTDRNPFDASGDRASVVAFIEQRIAFASSDLEPQVLEMSSSRAPDDFERNVIPRDDDAISIRLRGQKLNKIVALVPGASPMVLTAGQEFRLEGGDNKGFLTPGNLIPRPVSVRGSAEFPKPITVGDVIMHVLPEGNRLRTLQPDGSPSTDLTLLARNLFRGRTITSMAYAQAPHSVVWMTLDDGALLSLTFVQEHQVWGWTRHVLGGGAFVHQVVVIREGAHDTPYFVVRRNIDAIAVRLVERLAPRDFVEVEDAYFVDAGATFTGSDFTSVRGLLHLRNKEVSVLSDGNVLADLMITARGQLTLPIAADVAHIGLGYQARIVPVDIDFGAMRDAGTSLGRLKAVGEIAVMADRTRGIKVGREDGPLNEVKEFSGEVPIPLFTGTYLVTVEGNWVRDATIEIVQDYPLPMTITAVGPDWDMEEAD